MAAAASLLIAHTLEERIAAGELEPGDRTPSVRTLARDFGVSPSTASKALSHLAGLGLAESRPGVGMIVLQPRPVALLSEDRGAMARHTGTVNRPGEYAKRISAREEKASARVRVALAINTARAFCRRRVRFDAADRPIEHSTSWFALDTAKLAPRLQDLAAIEEGTLSYVQKATGRRIVATREDIYARKADALDVQQRLASKGSPVLVVEFTAYDEQENPLTYEEAVFPEGVRVGADGRR